MLPTQRIQGPTGLTSAQQTNQKSSSDLLKRVDTYHNLYQKNRLPIAKITSEEINYIGSNGMNLIHLAVTKGDVDTLQTLLGMGGDLTKYTDEGHTVATLAASTGQSKILDYLKTEAGDMGKNMLLIPASINDAGLTPFQIAANNSSTALGLTGKEVGAGDLAGFTAAHIAAKFWSYHALKKMSKAELETPCGEGDCVGMTPLMHMITTFHEIQKPSPYNNKRQNSSSKED